MRKYWYLFTILLMSLLVVSCEDSTTDPDPDAATGSIYIQSNPAGAQIWVDNANSGKVTPDSVRNLSVGSHTVTLKLSDYRDTTFTLNVTEGFQTSRSVTLTSDVEVEAYGPIRIWETTGTTAAQPSGLDLSAGTAKSSTDNTIDIYYSSAGFVIRTSQNRSTVFYVGNSTNINDGTDSPLALNAGQGNWLDRVSDREENYFFLFDQDSRYSKMEIVEWGGGNQGEPAWVEVQWYYNKKDNDRRF